MSDDLESASMALPTRRALREAERRASTERARRTARESSPHATSTTVETTADDLAASSSDVEPVAAQTSAAPAAATPPSRAAAAPESGASRRFRSPGARLARRWVPRLAVLGSLAIATTAIPLSGAASPTSATTSASFSAVSALDVLTAEEVDGTDAYSASFEADPMAAARAMLGASRDEDDRGVLQCGSAELEANGQVAAGATTEPVEIMMPLTTGSYTITSQFGYRWGGMHEGLDMAAPEGTPIHAVAAGEVTYVGYGLQGRSGQIIVIEHNVDGEIFWTWYIHMYPNGVFVDVGDHVAAGQVIGEVGSYGNSTGPHLHLEVHVGDETTAIDPAPWLEEHNAAPLTDENLACAAG